MSGNFLNVGKNTYELLDDTVTSPHDFVRCLYHFVNKGMDLNMASGIRLVDEHQVSEAIISAKSFADAISIFENEMPLSSGGQLVTVEFFGVDCKVRNEDDYVVMSEICRL